jgi:hypothetical protein
MAESPPVLIGKDKILVILFRKIATDSCAYLFTIDDALL